MKTTQKVNYRVVVEPYRSRWGGSNDARTCDDIASQIRRHVDEIGTVSVEYDNEAKCEHCGSDWTEDSPIYNGGCCDADHAPCAAVEAIADFFAAMKVSEVAE